MREVSRSIWFDLKIILLTILRGFVGRNVY